MTHTAGNTTQSTAPRKTIAQMFEMSRARSEIALMPFVAAGYPDLATMAAVLPIMERAGASMIEIGIPFSDPIADGPTIQEAFNDSLTRKVKVSQILETVAGARASVSIPLVAMVSYSVVFRYGVDRFLTDAKQAGFDGLILPDLPPPEGQAVCDKVRGAGLDTVLLVAPTTTEKRREEIARLSSGFIYYLSISGITGERDKLPANLPGNVKQLKQMTDTPVCVGFGVSRREHVTDLRDKAGADGAIVGSAIVKRMKQFAPDGVDRISAEVGQYCRELLGGV